jgi:hypothetical protein
LKLKWATLLLTIWVLIVGLLISYRGFYLLVGVTVGGTALPLGPMAFVPLLIAGIKLFRKDPGARIIAAVILTIGLLGALSFFLRQLIGTWPYDNSLPVQILALGYLLLNGVGLWFLWFNKAGNPYARSQESETTDDEKSSS